MERIKNLFKLLVEYKGSDLFLQVNSKPYMRINGVVEKLEDSPVFKKEMMEEIFNYLLDDRLKERFSKSPDLDLAFYEPDYGRFRINVFRQQGQIGFVIRLIHKGELTFESLNLPDTVRKLAEKMRGLVLVTGSAGSGKSTTIAAMIHHINKTRKAHIVTIEDPIEYVHSNIKSLINQRQVGQDTNSFIDALRSVVRQSPDVIVIGEIRDLETIKIAISAALTGHLVISTMHTIDTVQTLDRIVYFFPEYVRRQIRKELSLCLQGIVSQRLLRRADGKGRIPAVEVMIVTPPIKKCLEEGRHEDIKEIMLRDKLEGMKTFEKALIELIKSGLITKEEALRNASNPERIKMFLRGLFTSIDTFQ